MKYQWNIELWSNGHLLQFARVYCVNPRRTRAYREMLVDSYGRNGIINIKKLR